MGMAMTRHGRCRIQQRGIRDESVETLVAWGDAVPVGGGATSLTLGRAAAAEMAAEGVPPAAIDRLRRLAVVVADDGVVVTCMVLRRSGRGKRRYRQGMN